MKTKLRSLDLLYLKSLKILELPNKKRVLVLSVLLFIAVGFLQCQKDTNITPSTNTPTSCTITFWTDTNNGYIYVTFNGSTQEMTKSYSSNPGCGAQGCVSFTASSGTYNWSATTNNGITWGGGSAQIAVTAGQTCLTEELQ